MAMEISNNYSNYASSYTNVAGTKKKASESSTAQTTAETGSMIPKTAADVFSAAKTENKNYRSGNYPNKLDVMIASSILEKMASDPKEAQKYEKMLSDIPMCEK